ncbi:MAG: hypothetical protein ACI97A_002966 [Planctomycetota bacterium]|jgi:uncharacterized protein YhaN
MRIERLKIDGFGSFNRGIDIDFNNGRLSLVIGRNEAGKSTIMSAIFGILFGFKDNNLKNKFEPWEEHESYSGEVVVRNEAGNLVTFRRDFTDHSAEILECKDEEWTSVFLGSANPRGHSDDDIEYYQRLEDAVGFQDEAVFRGTVFVGQSALQTSITDQIRKLVSGSTSTDFKGVLHDLHAKFSELTMENPWGQKSKAKPRKLEKLKNGVEANVARLEEARDKFLQTMTLEQEVKKLAEKQADNKSQLDGDRATLTHFERFCKLVKDRDASTTRFSESDKRRATYLEMKNRVISIDKKIKSDLAHYTKVGDEFPELVTRLKSETGELESTEQLLARDQDILHHLKPQPNNKLGAILGLGGIVVGALAMQSLGPVVGGVLMAIGGAGLFFGGRMLGTGFRERKEELENAIKEKSGQVRRRRSSIEELIGQSQGVLGLDDPDQILGRYRQFKRLMEERRERISGMKVLGDWGEIDSTYQKTAEENLRCNGLMELILEDAPFLSALADDKMAIASNMEELKRRIEYLAEEIEVTREVLTDAKINLAQAGADVDYDLPALEETVTVESRQVKKLEVERDALRIVIDTLDECVTEFQEGDLTKLSEEVSGIFRGITSNRYTRVTLSPNMEPMLTKYDNTHIQPTDLSQGTQDQLYFAMRVAIARHLSKHVSLPFFLDDPFVNFDQERLDVTKEMLDALDDHQIVLVTCDRDYESWSEKILDLDTARAESMANPNATLTLSANA